MEEKINGLIVNTQLIKQTPVNSYGPMLILLTKASCVNYVKEVFFLSERVPDVSPILWGVLSGQTSDLHSCHRKLQFINTIIK